MLKKIALFLGPIIGLLIFFSPIEFISTQADDVLGLAIWMIIWWITEVVSISVTALIPLTFFPLLGIMTIKEVSAFYGHPIIFLFFGGFILALALEKVLLHKRIALNIIKITGSKPDSVLLGFMISTAFLSMWISNTATTVVMLPIAYSVINLLSNDHDGFTQKDKKFALSLMLGIAYSANVGGVATIIGTPPNVVLAGFLEDEYGYIISFVDWMMIGIPFSIIMIGIIYILLTKILFKSDLSGHNDIAYLIDSELKKLGKISSEEKIILFIFLSAIVLWISKNIINGFFPSLKLTDTSISMLAAFACFCVTLKRSNILLWEDTKRLPWGILILFGGGLALANALSAAGIIDLIGNFVSQHNGWSPVIIGTILIAVILMMTELMSNVALLTIVAPMIAGVALGLDIDLLRLLIPITIATSCAFMLPMATPPNAIVFASGHVRVEEMAKTGIYLNIISILLLVVFFQFIIPMIVAM